MPQQVCVILCMVKLFICKSKDTIDSTNCLVVFRNPPGFAFLVFKHSDDAESAVRKLHGR